MSDEDEYPDTTIFVSADTVNGNVRTDKNEMDDVSVKRDHPVEDRTGFFRKRYSRRPNSRLFLLMPVRICCWIISWPVSVNGR